MVGHEAEAADPAAAIVRLDIPARLDLVTVVRMVAAASSSAGEAVDGDRLDDLRWAVSEATTNAIEANRRTGRVGRVQVEFEMVPGSVSVGVSDEGPGMPALAEIPEMEDPERLATEGGFGIPLMQMLASAPLRFDTGPEGTTVLLRLDQR